MARRRWDWYYRKAKQEGYRSRASYKLIQICEKFDIIRENNIVIDLGASPGGWLQVARELSHGMVVGVDLKSIEPLEGALTLRGDMRGEGVLERVRQLTGGQVNVVLSDAAPNLSGNWSYDHARSIELAENALMWAKALLAPGGRLVCKTFQGDLLEHYLASVRECFERVSMFTPKASRKESAEIYVVARGFFEPALRVGDVHSVLVESLSERGEGVAKVDNFVVFVRDGEVGEQLDVRIEKVKPTFATATSLKPPHDS
ncbi:MAG: 23S rRNA (uridine(2552)-2'-O)-methyltransferase [Methermicoccaceae archaeon]